MGFILPALVILGIALLSGPFGIVILLAAIGGAISGAVNSKPGKRKRRIRMSEDAIVSWVVGIPMGIIALFAIVCLFYPPAMGLLDKLSW